MATDPLLEVIQRVSDVKDENTLRRFTEQVRNALNGIIRSGVLTRGDSPGTSGIVIPLASPSGLEFTSGSLRIDLDTNILTITSPGLGFATQAKNTALRGPSSGANAVPTFRVPVAADFGSGSADSTTFLAGDLVWRVASGSGSSSVPFGVTGPFTSPVADFTTWVNQGSRGSFDSTSGFAYLEDVGAMNDAENLIGRVKSSGSTPWTLTGAFQLNFGYGANCSGGLMFRDSSTGRIKGFAVRNVKHGTVSGGFAKLNLWSWSSATAFNAAHFADTWSATRGVVYLRIVNDGTDIKYYTSTDYFHWLENFSEAVSGNYVATVDQCGYFLNSISSPLSNACHAGIIMYHLALT